MYTVEATWVFSFSVSNPNFKRERAADMAGVEAIVASYDAENGDFGPGRELVELTVWQTAKSDAFIERAWRVRGGDLVELDIAHFSLYPDGHIEMGQAND